MPIRYFEIGLAERLGHERVAPPVIRAYVTRPDVHAPVRGETRVY